MQRAAISVRSRATARQLVTAAAAVPWRAAAPLPHAARGILLQARAAQSELVPASPPSTSPLPSASPSPSPSPSPTSVQPTRTPVGRSFFDVMKFNGPGPELVNGRLAMLGLLLAARSEMLTGQTVMQQMAAPQGSLVAAMLVIVYASLVPLLKGPFTPRAEVTNGRAAMLGFAVLLALEAKAGVPFF